MTSLAPRPSVRPWAPIMLLAALALTLTLGACDQQANGKDAAETASAGEARAATATPPAVPAYRTVVEVRALTAQDFVQTGTYVGHLLPRERVQLRSEIDGVAEDVRFDESDQVGRGQLLANISTGQLRVRRDQARADLKLAESNYQREQTLHVKQLVPDSQLEQTRTRLELARLALRLAEIELDKSQVNSPIAGTVKTRGVSAGEFMNKGQLIAEILDVSRVRALFNVPEREVRHIRQGGTVEVTFEALPGERRSGVVRTIGLEADLKSRTFPVEVELDNAERTLRPGMLARVAVALQHYRDQVLIPRYAVLEREAGPVVFVVRDGLAEERRIALGAGADGQVQVLRGLEPGEQLVVTGHQKLTPGEPLEVRSVQK